MSKTVRALALAALFVLGGTAAGQAATGPGAAAGRTVAAVAAGPCMAC